MTVPYYYIKTALPGQQLVQKRKTAVLWRKLSLFAVIIGVVLIGNVFWPILSYELTNFRFTQRLISPLTSQGAALGEETSVDYTDIRSWFPAAPVLPPQPSRITHYSLSIPKLGIEKATVQIGGEDLMESLIHYPGTALPGQYGNVVVFGHSVLPQFFNPKDYKAIFSTLPRLEEDDEIVVEFDGISYYYQVEKLVETSSEDVSVLSQNYDSQWLTLITCVPPGTYLKRLLVRAQLIAK